MAISPSMSGWGDENAGCRVRGRSLTCKPALLTNEVTPRNIGHFRMVPHAKDDYNNVSRNNHLWYRSYFRLIVAVIGNACNNCVNGGFWHFFETAKLKFESAEQSTLRENKISPDNQIRKA